MKKPEKETMLELWGKHGTSINAISKELGVSWAYAKQWLVDAGVINSLGQMLIPPQKITQAPVIKPDEVANQDSVQEQEEPADTSVLQGAPFDEATYNPEPIQTVNPYGVGKPGEVEVIILPVGQEISRPQAVPLDPTETALIDLTNNARVAVRKILANPIALALIKTLIERGVA